MKRNIKTLVLLLVCAFFAIKSGAQIGYGPLVIEKVGTFKNIVIGKVYTKAEIINLFGNPDKYNEWDSDGGKGFACTYGVNTLRFHPERGFESFVIDSNDFMIQHIQQILIGMIWDYITTSFPYNMEEAPGHTEGIRRLQVWPTGYVDSHLNLYFRQNGYEWVLFRIGYDVPV